MLKLSEPWYEILEKLSRVIRSCLECALDGGHDKSHADCIAELQVFLSNNEHQRHRANIHGAIQYHEHFPADDLWDEEVVVFANGVD